MATRLRVKVSLSIIHITWGGEAGLFQNPTVASIAMNAAAPATSARINALRREPGAGGSALALST